MTTEEREWTRPVDVTPEGAESGRLDRGASPGPYSFLVGADANRQIERQILEREITAQIQHFERATGLIVTSIYVEDHEGPERPAGSIVRVTAELPVA